MTNTILTLLIMQFTINFFFLQKKKELLLYYGNAIRLIPAFHCIPGLGVSTEDMQRLSPSF